MLLRDIEEMSNAEVSELLEITEGTVKIRLHRARAALKKLLEPVSGARSNDEQHPKAPASCPERHRDTSPSIRGNPPRI